MNENAIDVICPVYNAEKTISKCIDSVLAQRHTNWKMILVDDGSTDNSAEIIKKYVETYPDKFLYYYQDNSGPSVARNLGIEKGSSPYICFIDSDDFIDEDWLESFNNAIVLSGGGG